MCHPVIISKVDFSYRDTSDFLSCLSIVICIYMYICTQFKCDNRSRIDCAIYLRFLSSKIYFELTS